jgi:hypothetical protein
VNVAPLLGPWSVLATSAQHFYRGLRFPWLLHHVNRF